MDILQNIQKILDQNGIPALELQAPPGRIFFVQHDFLEKYCSICNLPQEQRPPLFALAAKIRQDALLGGVAWHLYRLYITQGPLHSFPDFLKLPQFPSENTGVLYQLITLAIVPDIEKRMLSSGLGLEYAHLAVQRISNMWIYRRLKYDLPGINGGNGLAVRNFLADNFFRIGPFEYEIVPYDDFSHLPPIFQAKDGTILEFVPSKIKIDPRTGYMTTGDLGVPATLRITEDTVTGHLIDLQTGRMALNATCHSLRELTLLTPPGCYHANFHIPYGCRLTSENCLNGFREAGAFFRKYLPQKIPQVIFVISWVCNPELISYIPHSNIARFNQLGGYFFVTSDHPKEGLGFVFGRDDGEVASYPRNTSLERGMIDCYLEHNKVLLSGCRFFLYNQFFT